MDSGIDILNLNWNDYTNCSADNTLLEKPCATEIDYPVEAILEMAIASFLDTEALSFADCKPGRGQ